ALKEKYDDPECLLVWPETFLTDRRLEFRGDCEKLMREHDVKIQKAFTKDTMGITEKYNGDLTRKLFRSQDASNLLTLHLNKISWVW
ncbi:13940_t:CDS:1, partial [Funneliformis caledonium]